MSDPVEAQSRAAVLLEVWECSGCGHHYLAVRYRGGLWVEHEVTGALVAEKIAPGGWRLARRCAQCGGVVSILYAHAALTHSGRLVVFRDADAIVAGERACLN